MPQQISYGKNGEEIDARIGKCGGHVRLRDEVASLSMKKSIYTFVLLEQYIPIMNSRVAIFVWRKRFRQ